MSLIPPAILIVDDNSRLRYLTRTYIEKLGYQVFEAEDVDMAMQVLINNKNIVFLLTDVMLGDEVLGSELIELALRIKTDLKFAFMSGSPKAYLLKTGRIKNESHLLLQKPFTATQLSELVFKVIYGL